MFLDGKYGNSRFALIPNQTEKNLNNISIIERAIVRFLDPKYID